MTEKLLLSQLKNYKDEILKMLVNDQFLCRAIANNEESCLLKPVESPGDLLYTKIFPYKYVIDETQEEANTYLSMDMAVFSNGSYFYDFSIAIYIITHKSLMRVKVGDDYQLRTDYLLSKVETTLQQTKKLGMGDLTLQGSGSTFYSAAFPCFYAHYLTTDISGKQSNLRP